MYSVYRNSVCLLSPLLFLISSVASKHQLLTFMSSGTLTGTQVLMQMKFPLGGADVTLLKITYPQSSYYVQRATLSSHYTISFRIHY